MYFIPETLKEVGLFMLYILSVSGIFLVVLSIFGISIEGFHLTIGIASTLLYCDKILRIRIDDNNTQSKNR